ncbi:hypothetical protein PTI98_000262 [Pleurotus ostreatus]|nr:hypothetical protein PTI98_000262 [Pleurotus ostreatus]
MVMNSPLYPCEDATKFRQGLPSFLNSKSPTAMTDAKQSKRRKTAAAYYRRNQDELREKARQRMSRLRANDAIKSEEARDKAAASKRASQAKYREGHRDILRAKAVRRRVSLHQRIPPVAAVAEAHESADEGVSDNEYSDVSDSGYLGDGNPSGSEGESEAADQTTFGVRGHVAKATPMLPNTFGVAEQMEVPRWLKKRNLPRCPLSDISNEEW